MGQFHENFWADRGNNQTQRALLAKSRGPIRICTSVLVSLQLYLSTARVQFQNLLYLKQKFNLKVLK